MNCRNCGAPREITGDCDYCGTPWIEGVAGGARKDLKPADTGGGSTPPTSTKRRAPLRFDHGEMEAQMYAAHICRWLDAAPGSVTVDIQRMPHEFGLRIRAVMGPYRAETFLSEHDERREPYMRTVQDMRRLQLERLCEDLRCQVRQHASAYSERP